MLHAGGGWTDASGVTQRASAEEDRRQGVPDNAHSSARAVRIRRVSGQQHALARCVLLCVAVVVSGCATQKIELTQTGREAISTLRALPPEARPRVVVAPLRDNTRVGQFSALEAGLVTGDHNTGGGQFLAGVRDLLVTGLLNTGAFTVLERDDLDELARERILRAEQGEAVRVDDTLEGADLVVAAAVSSFEPSGGGALPIPIPVGNDSFTIIWLRRGTTALSMDLRVLDVASGRVVHANAVRGEASRFSADLDVFIGLGRSYLPLPGVLRYLDKTPLHAAIMQMVTLTVGEVGNAARDGAALADQSAVAR